MSNLKVNPSVQQNTYSKSKGKASNLKVNVPPEQVNYANLLLYGAWAGIAMLTISFFLYMSGIVGSYIHPSQMPQYWGMSASQYLQAANVPHGWGWFKMIGYGDFLNLLGVTFLAGLTVIAYLLILIPAYLRKKDVAYSTIVIIEVLVLVVAASGILGVGAH